MWSLVRFPAVYNNQRNKQLLNVVSIGLMVWKIERKLVIIELINVYFHLVIVIKTLEFCRGLIFTCF